jgi:hypothetical protein
MFKSLNERLERLLETGEVYLSVEYNESHPHKQTLVLYRGAAVVDSTEIDLADPLHTPDEDVREIAKQHFGNIADDIRVAWF